MIKHLLSLILILTLCSSLQGQEVFFDASKNPSVSYCCGIADCGLVTPESIHIQSDGYRLDGIVSYFKDIHNSTGDKNGPFSHSETIHETIPFSEAKPSPDGAYWRCRQPDGSRRCFYAPPQGS